MNIDAHVHIWNADRDRYPVASDTDPAKIAPPTFSPEELQAEQEGTGVERTVLIQMSFFGFDNSYMIDTIVAAPERYRGVAVIDHERDPAEIRAEMDGLKEHGVRGYRLSASAERAGTWGDSPGIQAMWAHGAENGQAMCLLADPGALPAIRTMVEKHPGTPVVIDHFARLGMRGNVDQEQLDQLLGLADFSRINVKTSAFYALGKKQPPYTDLSPMFRQLRDAYGSERLMWGSDCPYQVQDGHSYRASLDLVRERLDFLSEEEKEDILRRTAERVLFW